ncbi:hypothetical protein ES708_30048 [subsurface metagenome]
MTEEAILTMEAGRELDAQLAKLLGKPVYKNREGRWLIRTGSRSLDMTPLPYSTDIPAAWQVVEAMRNMKDEKGNQLLCCLKIHCDVPGEAWDIHWSYSELSIMDDGHKDHKLPLSWFSLPEAICKAALLTRLKGD